MPSGKTQTFEGKLLDHVFRATAYTATANVYVGLFTTAPTDTTAGTEVSGGSYARAPVPAATGGAAAWNAPSGNPRQISNVNAINWSTNPTADWGTIVAIGIFDALSGGTLLYYTTTQSDGSTAISKITQSGDTVSIAAGQLIISEN